METHLWKIDSKKMLIKNLEALANPDSLKQFKNIEELND